MDKKPHLLFDATLLSLGVRKTPARSGIFVVICNVLDRLIKSGEFRISLYCNPADFRELKRFMYTYFPEHADIPVINPVVHDKYNALRRQLIRKKELAGSQGRIAAKLYYKAILQPVKLFLKLRGSDYNLNAKMLRDVDVYFSPAYCAPPAVYKAKHIRRYTIMHDVIPLVFPYYFTASLGLSWANSLTTQIDNTPGKAAGLSGKIKALRYYILAKIGHSWTHDLVRKLNADDHGFSISEYTKRDFLRFNSKLDPDKIRVIPLAASPRFHIENNPDTLLAMRRKYHIPEDKAYLLSLCTIEPRKNLLAALRAFEAYLSESGADDVVFVLAGGQWASFQKEWDNLLATLPHCKGKIVLTGYIDDEDLAALYSDAEMFLFPSIYEGFGLPPLEAMQCGCPVIVSNASSIPEVVADAGLMSAPDDIPAIAKAIATIHNNPENHDKYAAAGLARAAQFSWDTTVRRMIDAIKSDA